MKKQWSRALGACAFSLTLAASSAQAQLLANSGFEAGLASWNTSAFLLEGYDYGVGDTAHSGALAFYGGGVQSPGFLFQSFATLTGQDYRVSFWVRSDGYTPNELTVRLNGVTLYTATDDLLHGFQQVQVGFRATGSSTELRFGIRNDSGFLWLDDIGVSPVPEPASAALFAIGVAAFAALRRRNQ